MKSIETKFDWAQILQRCSLGCLETIPKRSTLKDQENFVDREISGLDYGFQTFLKIPQTYACEESSQIDLQISSSCVIACIQPSQSVPSFPKDEITQNAREGGFREGKPKQQKPRP